MSDWEVSCCVLCSANCGIKVQLGGQDGREFIRIKGDEEHPGSQGYLCNKASRLNHYVNSRDRLLQPLRKNASGGFDEINWDTAIAEIAEKLSAVKHTYGGDKIFYYGGGGQANHTPGLYSRTTNSALGVRYRSNALAQEKTGEFWVCDEMFGGWPHPDVEHSDLAIFIGKNPWHSHGIPKARATLRAISKDPTRKMIVIDPKRTETADLADIHLAVKPARDAWLFAAIAATIVQQDMYDSDFLNMHITGHETLFNSLRSIDISSFADICGISEAMIQETAQLIADSERVAVLEDLGIQMNRHSTLVSYLQRLMWVLTGNFGKPGTQYLPLGFGAIGAGRRLGKTPVTGAPIIAGLIPCNSVAEEILTDHPDRFRAMIIESGNPVHSLAESQTFRDAMAALDITVVIDVAMTETAMAADYVLPVANQYEKAEAAFFNFEFPNNHFQVRQPLFAPPENVLTEAEIHCRLAEAMGAVPEDIIDQLNTALEVSRIEFQTKVFELLSANPSLMGIAPALLHRTLAHYLPENMRNAVGLWIPAMEFALANPDQVNRAGITDQGEGLGWALFDRMISSPSGFTFSSEDWEACWSRLGGGHIQLGNGELIEEIDVLKAGAPAETNDEFPFLLSAGERRAYTANTIVRDPEWRRKDAQGALHIHPEDAARLNLGSGSTATLITEAGEAMVEVEISDRMMRGHVAIPNGLGLHYPDDDGNPVLTGVAPNELTSLSMRDKFAGTPWHKSVPVRIEAG